MNTPEESAQPILPVVRLSVNLACDVAGVLQFMASEDGVTITEEIRRCISDRFLARTALQLATEDFNALLYEQYTLPLAFEKSEQ